jgi:hypothetical protein
VAEIIIKNSFWKSLVYALLNSVVGVSFVWIGYNYLRPHITSLEKDFSYWIATGLLWFGVLMFWLLTILMLWGAYYFFRAVFDFTPQIIFDEKGIFSKKFKTGKVFWSEIKEAGSVLILWCWQFLYQNSSKSGCFVTLKTLRLGLLTNKALSKVIQGAPVKVKKTVVSVTVFWQP